MSLRRLTIDEGNTSTKMALWEGSTIVGQWCGADAPDTLDVLVPQGEKVDSIIVSTVRKDSVLESRFGSAASRFIRLSADTPLPFVLGYATPSSLGADRIAAAAGAASIAGGSAAFIVDIGTAVTYDYLSAKGVFEGGNIAPGIELRLKSLADCTSALPAVGSDGPAPLLGDTTATAMRSGAIRGIVAETEYYRSRLSLLAPSLITIITGGSATLVTPFISSPFIHDPALVMTGLKHILEYNEAN